MSMLPLAEAKNRFSELVAAAERGEETIVTRHGRPAARIVGVEAGGPKQRQSEAVRELFAFACERKPRANPVTADDIIAWRDEERR